MIHKSKCIYSQPNCDKCIKKLSNLVIKVGYFGDIDLPEGLNHQIIGSNDKKFRPIKHCIRTFTKFEDAQHFITECFAPSTTLTNILFATTHCNGRRIADVLNISEKTLNNIYIKDCQNHKLRQSAV
jgi:hypothetical protein